MELGGLFCEYQQSEVQDMECSLCALQPPINPVVTGCDHCFCWPCMYQFLQGQAKPCPVCSTMLSSNTDVAPTFDVHGAMVLGLPIAEEVKISRDDDDDLLDSSAIAAFSAAAAPRSNEEPMPVRGEISQGVCRVR